MKFGDTVRHVFLKSTDLFVLSGAANGKGVVCRYWSEAQGRFETVELLEKELQLFNKKSSNGFASMV